MLPPQTQMQGPPPQMPPQGAPPQMPGGANPNLQAFGQMAAQQGRGGDALVAHLTPGEIMVPPQIQTPELMAILQQAFSQAGAKPQQFTAGSPQSKMNPQTGMPEYGFFDSLLPTLLGAGGSFLFPELMPTVLGSGLLSQSVGGGLGTMLGDMMSGQGMGNSALAGLGALGGSYGLGSLVGGKPAAQQTADASSPANASGATTPLIPGSGNLTAGQSGPPMPALDPSWKNLWGTTKENINPMGLAGMAGGGMIPGMLGLGSSPTTDTQNSPRPGFNDPMPPQGSWQNSLGQNNYQGPMANFSGYNPYASNSTGFNFYR